MGDEDRVRDVVAKNTINLLHSIGMSGAQAEILWRGETKLEEKDCRLCKVWALCYSASLVKPDCVDGSHYTVRADLPLQLWRKSNG